MKDDEEIETIEKMVHYTYLTIDELLVLVYLNQANMLLSGKMEKLKILELCQEDL